MAETIPSVLLSRLDFAWITTFHILYPPLTIGLAAMLFVGESFWLYTKEEHWYRLSRFFERLFIINFAAGVATGITMEMAFGILYGPFSQAAGPFFGQVLGYETISAFMYEAGFIGLMIFGWGKIGRKTHLFATFNVAASASISAMWILDANSWMQTPTGVTLQHGVFHVSSWTKALFNSDVIYAFPHMLVAAWELAIGYVLAVSAWYLLKGRHTVMFQRAAKASTLALLIIAPLQIWLGDGLGMIVLREQPPTLAAMEGHWHSHHTDGSVDNAWNVLAWPNAAGDGNAWALSIPHGLSLIETHTWNGAVRGLDEFSREDRPQMLIPFYGFRVMVACGGFMFLMAVWGTVLILSDQMNVHTVRTHRWFLRATVFSGVVPYFSVWVGWWTREVGRQPWIVYGLMRTEQGVSHMSVSEEVAWLVLYAGFELMVCGATWWFFAKIVRSGPNMNAPIAQGGDQRIGTLGDGSAARGQRETPKATDGAAPGIPHPA